MSLWGGEGGGSDEGDAVVLDNNNKGDTKYENLGQSPGGGDIGGGGWVDGSR